MEKVHSEHSLVSLLRELRDESSMLIRQEVALAKAEISEKISRTTRDAVLLAIGGLLALGAFGLFLLALRELLFVGMVKAGMSPSVALWFSPLLLAIITGAIGWVLIAKGKKELAKEGVTPHKTVESLREERQWLKRKLAHV
jgi:hypothetical protein